MQSLEQRGLLNRAVEFLPDDVAIAARTQRGQSFTRPELAVLLAYAKMSLDSELLASDLPEAPELAGELRDYFPSSVSSAHYITNIELLFDGLPEPIDLELDLANRALYWTDRGDPPRGNTVNRAAIDGPADRIVVEKQTHTLTLFRQGKVLKTYRVALGRGGAGPKFQAGDNRVPEGMYRIVGRNPHSAFHRAFKAPVSIPQDTVDFTYTWPRSASTS